MAFLQVVKGSRAGQVLELRGERIVLGRHPSCEIVLDNAAVSRQHAQITQRRGNFFLEDLHSRNHTFLNGLPIDARTPLANADEVKICDFVLQFRHASDDRAIALKENEGSTALGRSGQVEARGVGSDSGVSKPTRTLAQKPVPEEVDDEGSSQSSSIISKVDAKLTSVGRLNVNPEVKLRAILEISNTLAKTLNLDDVLQSLLDGLFKVFPQADSGFVLLAESDDSKPIVKSARARGGNSTGSVRISTTIVRQAMESGEAILSADALDDSRFNSSESLDGLAIRSMMCVPLIKSGRAFGVIQLDTTSLRQQFTHEDLEVLVSVGSQANLAIENAQLHEDLLERSDIERELSFATQVQLGFLPDRRPSPEGYEFFDYYEPAQRVGGDYFDYITLPDGRIAIGLADVAGKGIPAALLMARLYSSVRLHLFTQPNPGAVLSALNSEIYSQGMGHRFVTFVLLTLNPQTHELTIANAGHLPPIIRTAEGKTTSTGRKQSGLPLGITPKQDYGELKISIDPGTTVLVYTDGITEATNPSTELFGRARLEKFVAATDASTGDLVKAIVKEVDRFCDTYPQRDDMCLVCLRRLANR